MRMVFAVAMRIVSVVTLAVAASAALAAPNAPAFAQDDQEARMGKELFEELKGKGEIVSSSPLYDTLRPIADAISKVVEPAYQRPIDFYIVHEKQPNAFAAPGEPCTS